MIHNAIIIFTSDNGGPASGLNHNWATNWPLRGTKTTVFEGSTFITFSCNYPVGKHLFKSQHERYWEVLLFLLLTLSKF